MSRMGSFTSLVLVGQLGGGCLLIPVAGHHAPGPKLAFDRNASLEEIAGVYRNVGEPSVRLSELFWHEASPETHEAIDAVELTFPETWLLHVRPLPDGPPDREIEIFFRGKGRLRTNRPEVRWSRMGLVSHKLSIGLDERGDLRCDHDQERMHWLPGIMSVRTDRLRFERLEQAPGDSDEQRRNPPAEPPSDLGAVRERRRDRAVWPCR